MVGFLGRDDEVGFSYKVLCFFFLAVKNCPKSRKKEEKKKKEKRDSFVNLNVQTAPKSGIIHVCSFMMMILGNGTF